QCMTKNINCCLSVFIKLLWLVPVVMRYKQTFLPIKINQCLTDARLSGDKYRAIFINNGNGIEDKAATGANTLLRSLKHMIRIELGFVFGKGEPNTTVK